MRTGRAPSGDGVGSLASAELYDPGSGTFRATGSMSVAGGDHTSTVLRNGKVLVAGGSRGLSAELFDQEAETFTVTGSMIVGHGTSGIMVADGRVLITGGYDGTHFVRAAEIYDPVAGTFTATGSMSDARNRHTATLLPSGVVLIAGGFDGTASLTSADLFE